MNKTEFEPFKETAIKAVVVENFKQSRKFIDNICKEVELQSGEKVYWFRLNENSELTGGISKFLGEVKGELKEALSLKAESCVFLSAGVRKKAQNTAGVIIKRLGRALPELIDEEQYEFCWIVDFPMYEIGEESGELEFSHNPFSMPMGGMEAILKAKNGELDPTEIKAYQYDLVCNGVELSSGAVRNHNPKLMIEAFRMVGLDESDVVEKFPAMYNAFTYGAPPHAGIAPGVDRIIMLLSGDESIREVIAFPMNKNAQDLMMNAPSYVTDEQLNELGLIIKED
jgi:aspartyl-tRNA synthetase